MIPVRSGGFLGIVCGLAGEAAALDPGPGDRVRIAVAAANPDRAEAAARRFCAQGATALLSFGLCGGLDPRFGPGDLVSPARIMDGDSVHPVAPYRSRCGATRPDTGLGSETIVSTVNGKARLFARTGAAIVDMESHRVGRAARDHGVPLYILRAVCDPAGEGIPRAALAAIDEKGRPRPAAVLAGLVRRPADLSGLLRLRANVNVAMAALARAGRDDLAAILEQVEG